MPCRRRCGKSTGATGKDEQVLDSLPPPILQQHESPYIMPSPACVTDYRLLAQRRLPRWLFDFIDGGSCDEVTLNANRADLAALRLRQRVMRDVSKVETGATLFGQAVNMPLVLGPVGFAGMLARRGEVQAARAAERAGVPFCLGTLATCSLEEVRQAVKTPFWFQLYMLRDRGFVRSLLQRAQQAGCRVLVVTADVATGGVRYRDIRNNKSGGRLANLAGKAWELASHPAWTREVNLLGRPLVYGNLVDAIPNGRSNADMGSWVASQLDASLTWKDLGWLREHWDGPIIVKGILEIEDARSALDAGAAGIVVSNHGGRQLDTVRSTIAALPAIVDAVGGRLEVLMDGGVRSGQDLAKVLALGARAALVGRPWMWALAAGGEAGVAAMLQKLRRELEVGMALQGIVEVSGITRAALDLD
jgi:L-lactate dehydrogenase (cytochrome)